MQQTSGFLASARRKPAKFCRRSTRSLGLLSAAQKLHSDISQGHEAQGKEEGCPDVFYFHERDSGLETVALPDSVNSDLSSASLALARCIESAVVSIHPDPVSASNSSTPNYVLRRSSDLQSRSVVHGPWRVL